MILNLTQHEATAEQLEAGVIEPPPGVKESIKALLTFEDIPSVEEIRERALRLAEIAETLTRPKAMIGGAKCLVRLLRHDLNFGPVLRHQLEEALGRPELLLEHRVVAVRELL